MSLKNLSKVGISLLVVHVILLSFPLSQAIALQFFSVNTLANELVRIDAATGGVSVVGELGFDAYDTDLASFDGRLFGVDYGSGAAQLIEINPFTGATISSTHVTNDGSTVSFSEGLTNVGNQLKIAVGVSPYSTTYGDLSLDGTMSNAVGADGRDFDGMGVSSTGQIYGLDVITPLSSTKFFTFDPSTATASEIFSFSTSSPSKVWANDLVVSDSDIFAIDGKYNTLHQIGLSDGTLNTIDLSENGQFRGLAAAVTKPIPEPGTSFLLGLGFAGIATLRRRKRTFNIGNPNAR